LGRRRLFTNWEFGIPKDPKEDLSESFFQKGIGENLSFNKFFNSIRTGGNILKKLAGGKNWGVTWLGLDRDFTYSHGQGRRVGKRFKIFLTFWVYFKSRSNCRAILPRDYIS